MSNRRNSSGLDFDPPARNVLLANLVTTIFVALGMLAVFITVVIISVRQGNGTSATAASLEFLSLESSPSSVGISVYGGTADGTRHSFAGKVMYPLPGATCLGTQGYHYGCGASLVTIPGLPNRRMAITAGHCATPGILNNVQRYVSFDEVPAATLKTDCPDRAMLLNPDLSRWFSVKKIWSANDGSTLGLTKSDWAIMLLDNEVPSSVVPNPAVMMTSARIQDLTELTLPQVGMASYGVSGFGPDGVVAPGRPIRVYNNSTRTYVQLDVQSVTPHGIGVQFTEESACKGDSGSAAFVPTAGAPWMIWGTFSLTDKWCRAVGTFARTDTSNYRTWLQSIQADILANA